MRWDPDLAPIFTSKKERPPWAHNQASKSDGGYGRTV